MMRACLLLGVIFTNAQATLTTGDIATCSINGVEATDELVNSVLFIWQAASNCGHASTAACSVDVNSAIESVTGMANVILKAVQRCGGQLQSMHARCGLAAGEVTEALAGIAATSSGISEHCGKDGIAPVKGLRKEFLIGSNHMSPKLAHCVVDIKSLTKTVLKASLGFATVKTNCDESTGNCVGNVLYIVTAMAEMGEFIAGVVGQCSEPVNQDAACASEVLGLLRSLGHLGSAGHELAQACVLNQAERLYVENGGDDVVKAQEETTNSHLVNFGLAALLPITAVLSFVGGRRMARSGRSPSYDTEMMVSGEE